MNRKLVLLATTIGVVTLALASGLLLAMSRAAPPGDGDDMALATPELGQIQPEPAITVRDLDEETVLYTIHEGTYESAIDSIERLQQIRDENGWSSSGDFGYFLYLNDPEPGREEDRLIEIRLPVEPAALAAADAIQSEASANGLGTTGVKQVWPARVASVPKRAGVSDPTPLWDDVYAYAESVGLDSSLGPIERFDGISGIPATCAYNELETELMVGIQ